MSKDIPKQPKEPEWYRRRRAIHRHPSFRKLTPNEFSVFCVTQEYVNINTCLCWPSLKTIAEILRVDETVVSKGRNGLIRKGFFKVIRRGANQKSTIIEYTVPGEDHVANECNVPQIFADDHVATLAAHVANECNVHVANESDVHVANECNGTSNLTSNSNMQRTTKAEIGISDEQGDDEDGIGEEYWTDKEVIEKIVLYGTNNQLARRFLEDYGKGRSLQLLRLLRLKEIYPDEEFTFEQFCRFATDPKCNLNKKPIVFPRNIDEKPLPPKDHCPITPYQPKKDNPPSSK